MQTQRLPALWLSFIFIMTLVLFSFASYAQEETAEPADNQSLRYIVQPGDTLYRIALRFNTTTSIIAAANGITNTREIYSGQVLLIPGQSQPVATPSFPRPEDLTGSATYVVQRGDTLYRIAIANGTTVAALVAANNLANPNAIFAGQVLVIPGNTPVTPPTEPPIIPTSLPTDAVTPNVPTVEPTVEAVVPTPSEEPLVAQPVADFAYGVTAYFGGLDAANVAQNVVELGADWVRVRVDWSEIESVQGELDFASLDAIIDALELRGLNILFTVTNSPAWARNDINENGPPNNVEDFARFLETMASRYAGRVAAYQIWDEPNLRRNWHCAMRLCDLEYTDLLRPAFAAIKGSDAGALVITAGLAPSGFNDGINAINDRLYLDRIYQTGGSLISDAIGVHAPGWANPPDARCCVQSSGVETHFEDSSFYFLETIEAYRAIMEDNNDSGTPIWITRFGWGTNTDLGPLPIITDTEGNQVQNPNVFVTYIDLVQQAIYVERAFEIGREKGYIGPMFLDNLNACQASDARAELCFYSVIGPENTPRPVIDSVSTNEGAFAPIPESPQASPETTPEM
jgi:LysM repeat protein